MLQAGHPKHLLIPDEVLAENSYSKKVYQEGNYRNIKVMPRIFRLAYLEKINRKKIEQNTILVAAAMHDGEQLFLHLSNEMNNNNNIYYFKFHPRGRDVMYLMKANNSKNIFIANKDLNYYLSFVSKVIVTQSSVGYEAYTLDIPVRVVSLPNKINDSPLLDISESSNSNLIEIDYMN